MKQIGHVDNATTDKIWRTHSLGMLASHALFIPNPGERETVDTEAFEQIGWVNPDKDGGAIYTEHKDAAEHGPARPAYVRRYSDGGVVGEGLSRRFVMGEKPSESTMSTRTVTGLDPDDPMDVRRSEFDALTKRLDLLAESTGERIWALEKIRHQRTKFEVDPNPPQHLPFMEPDKVAAKIGMSKTYGENGHMLTRSIDTEPPDLSMHAFRISTDDLIKEALEFCDTGLGGWDGVEVEAGCQRAGVYIRELIGRLHGARQPKPAPTVHAEPPMSFYDHAFLTSFSMQSAHIPMSDALTQSHDVARQLDRDRKSRT